LFETLGLTRLQRDRFRQQQRTFPQARDADGVRHLRKVCDGLAQHVHKAFIPEDLVKDSKDEVKSKKFEDNRLAYLKTVMPGVAPTDVVKFAQLDRHSKLETGQLLLPSSITHMFAGECFPLSGPGGAEVQVPSGTMNFPNIAYRSAKYRADWKILSETATAAGCS
jgi:hypothetical protein